MLRIAAVQLDIRWEDKAANFERARALVLAAAPPPGSLIVFPEMFSTGFSMNVPVVAETAERETEAFLRRLARETGSAVMGGVVTRQADGRGLNEALIVGPDGEPLARYAKLHPFSYAGEHRHYAPGDAVVTFEWGGLRIAPFVCYDLRFPEAYRAAVRQGARVLITIANFPAAREHHWVSLSVARAIENQAYGVAVNRCGSDPNAPYSGRSLILSPRGETLADAGGAEGVIMADLDPAEVERYRTEFPALADMRPDLLPGGSGVGAPPAACPA